MRVTSRMIVENAIHAMQDNLSRLEALRNKAASGKQFQAASDDPEAAAAALGLRSSLQTSQAYLNTAMMTRDWMGASEIALKQLVDLGTQALNKALDCISDSYDAGGLAAVAVELDTFLKQAIDLGNTDHLGKHLFAGFKTGTKPFTLTSGSPDIVDYDGDNGLIQHNLGPEQSITVNILGDEVLSPFYAALIEVRDALYANDRTALTTAIEGLRTAHAGIIQARSINGARQQRVDALIGEGEEMQLLLKEFLSQKEDADMVEVISHLQQQENVYQAVLEVSRRSLATVSLFDLLS